MAVEQNIGSECIDVDMTPDYELGNRNEGDLEPERVQDLLKKGYQVNYDSENNRYNIKTYLGGKQYDASLMLSQFADGGINDLLIELIRNNVIMFPKDIVEKARDKYKDERVVNMLADEYKDYMLFKNGIKTYSVRSYNENSPADHLQSGINFLIESGETYSFSPETMGVLNSTTPETVLNDFHNGELENFLIVLSKYKDKSFEERRKDYIQSKKEEGKAEICDNSQSDLGELKYEITEGLNGFFQLTDFLEKNNFGQVLDGNLNKSYTQPLSGSNTYRSPDGSYEFSFRVEPNGNELGGNALEIKDIRDSDTPHTHLINMQIFEVTLSRLGLI